MHPLGINKEISFIKLIYTATATPENHGKMYKKALAFLVSEIQRLPGPSPHLALVFLRCLLGNRGTPRPRAAAAAVEEGEAC